jgi:hypothetical protein
VGVTFIQNPLPQKASSDMEKNIFYGHIYSFEKVTMVKRLINQYVWISTEPLFCESNKIVF